jgi:hypothetical protein
MRKIVGGDFRHRRWQYRVIEEDGKEVMHTFGSSPEAALLVWLKRHPGQYEVALGAE